MKRYIKPTILFWLFLVGHTAVAQAPWPGQSGNSVGYAAYGSLGTTPWPGGDFTSGTSSSPTVYTGYVFTGNVTISSGTSWVIFVGCDFNIGTDNTLTLSGDHIYFIGSRFQSNDAQGANVKIVGATNLGFFYDSFVPEVSLFSSPPGGTWPSAGAGTNSTTQTNGNSVPEGQGYQFPWYTSGSTEGPIVMDHCDLWGFGNAVAFSQTTAQMTLTNNWMHDAGNSDSPTAGYYHTDGPGYLNGGTGPDNVLIVGNVIASLGNTNAFAFQAADGGYSNIIVTSNYFSGFGNTISPGDIGPSYLTNSVFYGNVFGTDVEPVDTWSHGNMASSTNVWACNTVAFRSGTTWSVAGWTPSSFDNGLYWLNTTSAPPDSGMDQGGNTVCLNPAPSSLAWQHTSSVNQNVTLTCSNTGTCTFSKIALTTGTQFSIVSTTCGSSLSSGSSCGVTLRFNPTSLGIQQDTLQLKDNSPAPSSPQLVPLIGYSDGSVVAPPTNLTATVTP